MRVLGFQEQEPCSFTHYESATFLSNGNEAASGLSLLERAVKAAKPAIPISQIEPSAPPAKITSDVIHA